MKMSEGGKDIQMNLLFVNTRLTEFHWKNTHISDIFTFSSILSYHPNIY
jgi:hypothetical protein